MSNSPRPVDRCTVADRCTDNSLPDFDTRVSLSLSLNLNMI